MRYAKWARLVCAIGLASVLGLGVTTVAFAQSPTDGAIGGLITDQSGGILPGVTVSARNVATNAATTATTDGSGRFLVIRLPPGTYAVEVSLGGFSTFKRDSIVVEVGRVTNL